MALNSRTQRLLPYLDNPNVQKMLDLLSAAEGTTEFGYATAFGGAKIPDLADHPRVQKGFTQTDGRKNTSSAAGRYQFLERTWDDLADKLGLPDFGPRSQDLAALELIRRKGVLDEVANGNFDAAIKKLGVTWASLPSSPHPQNKRSWEWVDNTLADLGEPTPPGAQPVVMAQANLPSQEPATPSPGISASTLQAIRAAMPAGPAALTGGQPSRQTTPFQPLGGSSSLLQPWEEALLAGAVRTDADDARNQAVSAMLGEEPILDSNLPPALDRIIRRIVASI